MNGVLKNEIEYEISGYSDKLKNLLMLRLQIKEIWLI